MLTLVIDDVQAALATMKQHRVRRLPVEGFSGTVAGIVSMNDILLAAGPRKAVPQRVHARRRLVRQGSILSLVTAPVTSSLLAPLAVLDVWVWRLLDYGDAEGYRQGLTPLRHTLPRRGAVSRNRPIGRSRARRAP